jgi:hypothetical protein
MKDKKPFEETKLGKFLKSKGFDAALEKAGKYIPGVALLSDIKDAVLGSDTLTPEEKQEFIELYQLELQEYDLMLKDSANAREHDIRIQESENSSFLSKNVSYWIDLLIVVATIGIIYMLLFQDIPLTNKEMFYIAAGALMNMTATIISFHRGSTAKSQQKDKAIQELVGK